MKKVVLSSLALLTACGGITLASVIGSKKSETSQVVASDNMISGESFVRVDNFAYSNKGFILEFTFKKPTSNKSQTFSFMNTDSGWVRLTDRFTMTFKADGSVTSTVGHVFEIDGSYYFELMFSDLLPYLNKSSGEVADGTETLNALYFSNNDVSLEAVSAQVISTGMNAYPVTEFRNDLNPGLLFKAYIPSLDANANYGMIIVPSSYLKDAGPDYKKYFSDHSINILDLECSPTKLTSSDEIYKKFGNGYSIQGTIINIKESNYEIPFVAIPYYELNGTRVYANLIRNTKTSYYDKCLEFKKSSSYSSAMDNVKEEVNNVIYKCEHHATKVSLGSNIKAYFPYNTDKVFKADNLPEELVTENVMYSAKNETERGQVVINVPSSFSKKYFVSVEPFVNKDDPTAVIGRENVKIEQQLYQNVKTNWSVGGSQPSKWYPDGAPNNNLQLGYTPDALLPFDVAYDTKENVLTGTNGQNNAISYTINVPKNAKAGEYNSKIVIRINGEGTLALPIKLNVFDFVLPEENKCKQTITVSTGENTALYGSSAGLNSIYSQTAYEALRERNISGGLVPCSCWQVDDIPAFIEKTREYALDPRITSYYLPNSSEEVYLDLGIKKNSFKTETITVDGLLVYRAEDKNYSSSIVLPGVKTTLRELVKASTNEVDLLKKAIFYNPQADEPGDRANKHIQNVLCENVVRRCIDELLLEDLFSGKEKVKESLSKVRYFVTSYPRGYMKGENEFKSLTVKSGSEEACARCYCDSLSAVQYREVTGYCPTYDSFQYDIPGVADYGYADLMNKIKNPNYTVWWYGCIQPITPYPCMFVNGNLIQKRVNTWTMYQMGIQGELYYMCNRTQRHVNETDYPMSEEEILAGEAYYEGAYGDGSLLYPVHRMYGEYDKNLYWLSSLRLDNVSESIDDYNYIAYADEMINSLSSEEKTAYKDRLQALLSSVNDGPGRNTIDQDLFNEQRIALGNLVVELSKK